MCKIGLSSHFSRSPLFTENHPNTAVTGPFTFCFWLKCEQQVFCTVLAEAMSELEATAAARCHDRAWEESRLLAAIIESSDDAIISKDLNGIVTSWNRAAHRIFGYTAEEMIGRSILTVIPPELHYQETIILGKLKGGERIDHFETQRVGKSGRRLDVSLTISPILNEDGRVVGASKILRDVTRQKEIERLLLQAEKIAATGRMAASIAHEINNPLESVVNLIYLARNSNGISKQAREFLETAEREVERVSHIARQTMGFFRDTNRAVEVCVHDLLEDVLTVYRSKIYSRAVLVQRDYQPIRAIKLRKGELTQVLSNLIANAIDAMPNGGNLKVSAREASRGEREGIEIAVEDEGCGIPQQVMPQLFEAFFTTKTDTGNGLGLWVVKQIVEAHQGCVQVQGEVGKGSRFSVFMPFVNPYSGPSADQ
jgi:PAS domain S-box-containing protein